MNTTPIDVMVLARRFEQRTEIDRFEERMADNFEPMSYAACEILRARKFPDDRLAPGEPQRAILASVHGDQDTCKLI